MDEQHLHNDFLNGDESPVPIPPVQQGWNAMRQQLDVQLPAGGKRFFRFNQRWWRFAAGGASAVTLMVAVYWYAATQRTEKTKAYATRNAMVADSLNKEDSASEKFVVADSVAGKADDGGDGSGKNTADDAAGNNVPEKMNANEAAGNNTPAKTNANKAAGNNVPEKMNANEAAGNNAPAKTNANKAAGNNVPEKMNANNVAVSSAFPKRVSHVNNKTNSASSKGSGIEVMHVKKGSVDVGSAAKNAKEKENEKAANALADKNTANKETVKEKTSANIKNGLAKNTNSKPGKTGAGNKNNSPAAEVEASAKTNTSKDRTGSNAKTHGSGNIDQNDRNQKGGLNLSLFGRDSNNRRSTRPSSIETATTADKQQVNNSKSTNSAAPGKNGSTGNSPAFTLEKLSTAQNGRANFKGDRIPSASALRSDVVMNVSAGDWAKSGFFQNWKISLQLNVPLPLQGSTYYFSGPSGSSQAYRSLLPGIRLEKVLDNTSWSLDVTPFTSRTFNALVFQTTAKGVDSAGALRDSVPRSRALLKQFGSSATLQYHYQLSEKWGVSAGVEAAYWQNNNNLVRTRVQYLRTGTTIDSIGKADSTDRSKPFAKLSFSGVAEVYYQTGNWQAGLRVGVPFTKLLSDSTKTYHSPVQASLILRWRIPSFKRR